MATATAKHDITVGVFRSEAAARQAVAQLRGEGYSESDVHVVADSEHQRNEPGDISNDTVTRSNSGFVIGALIGAVAGLLVGFVVGSGLVPIPDLIRGIGPFGIVLVCTGAGAAFGLLGGSMVGMNQTRQETKGLEKAVEAGYWLVSVDHPDQNAARVALQKVGAVDFRVQTPKTESVKKRT